MCLVKKKEYAVIWNRRKLAVALTAVFNKINKLKSWRERDDIRKNKRSKAIKSMSIIRSLDSTQ